MLYVILAQCSAPTNGNFECPNGAATSLIGDSCTFSCNAGYELQGSKNGTCLANQSWSGGDPICVLICPTLLNAHVECDNENICTFSCNPGYSFRGITRGACKNTSGELPSCVPMNCTSSPDILGDDGVTVITSSSCDLAYQSQCTVSCDEGFTGDNVTYLCNVTSDPTMVDWVPIGGVDVMCERGLS